jgi:hypothetical protein
MGDCVGCRMRGRQTVASPQILQFRPATRERGSPSRQPEFRLNAGLCVCGDRRAERRVRMTLVLHCGDHLHLCCTWSQKLTAAMYAICDAVTMLCVVHTRMSLCASDMRMRDLILRISRANRSSIRVVGIDGLTSDWAQLQGLKCGAHRENFRPERPRA